MKTTQSRINRAEGLQFLRNALAHRRDERKSYGQYVQWAKQWDMKVEDIAGDWMKVFNVRIVTAMKKAKGVVSLYRDECQDIVDAMIRGEMDFSEALVRAIPRQSRSPQSPRPPQPAQPVQPVAPIEPIQAVQYVQSSEELEEQAKEWVKDGVRFLFKAKGQLKIKDAMAWLKAIYTEVSKEVFG